MKKPRPSANEVFCNSCQSYYFVTKKDPVPPKFCSYCGSQLDQISDNRPAEETTEVSFIPELLPSKDEVQFTVGHFQILQPIGKGGMGEVFLAYDTETGRRIALKRIRADLKEKKNLIEHFLKEARITCQLTHPSIMPIYSIHQTDDSIFYTMPYVKGKTLRQLINEAIKIEKKGGKSEDIGASIPSLIRIYFNVAQAIAYAHSRGIVHQDVKGENIMVGLFGEVLIFDWGLAKKLPKTSSSKEKKSKASGTISFLAPERAMGAAPSIQSDIYSLGVLLYLILTLKLPFQRPSLKEMIENLPFEEFTEPWQIAPYRDVPHHLSQIARKCLSPNPQDRYQTTEELIHEVENYMEGRSEWYETCQMRIDSKEDWLFQENVLIAEHTAITAKLEASDWVSLMISKRSFEPNIRIETKIKVAPSGYGIGFLLSVPEEEERKHLNDGYCVWIGTKEHKATKILKSTVEVLHAPEVYLEPDYWHSLRIEKVDNSIYFYMDDILKFNYISHIPLAGTHIGILNRDAQFELGELQISIGRDSVMINCLAVPDAFLAHQDYEKALTEYRRIGYTFPGRAEGREALFRAGITLLEQGRREQDENKAKNYAELALQEFENLRNTPAAPLEYLGKALVYKNLHEKDEEIKCYIMAYRRYPNLTLQHALEEQIVFRLHEFSRYDRPATYALCSLVNRHMHKANVNDLTKKLFNYLQRNWESLPFIQVDPFSDELKKLKRLSFDILLNFWLAKPYFIEESLEELLQYKKFYPISLENIFFSLLELRQWNLIENHLATIFEKRPVSDKQVLEQILAPFYLTIQIVKEDSQDLRKSIPAILFSELTFVKFRIFIFLVEHAIETGNKELVEFLLQNFPRKEIHEDKHYILDFYLIWSLFLERKWKEAEEVFSRYSLEKIIHETEDTHGLHFLYGCLLHVREGPEIAHAHFASSLDEPFPKSWKLATHYINGSIHEDTRWFQQSFYWERKQLYRQLALYYHCIGDEEKNVYYDQLSQKGPV